MTRHEIKVAQPNFDDMFRGRKRSEILADNPDFRVGDTILVLEQLSPADGLARGLYFEVTIQFIEKGQGLAPGFMLVCFEPTRKHFEMASRAAALEERERCATIAEWSADTAMKMADDERSRRPEASKALRFSSDVAMQIAKAIRAKSSEDTEPFVPPFVDAGAAVQN